MILRGPVRSKLDQWVYIKIPTNSQAQNKAIINTSDHPITSTTYLSTQNIFHHPSLLQNHLVPLHRCITINRSNIPHSQL